jgi:acetate---CoA ligase (ADP-forming)
MRDLTALFEPRSVALVGASNDRMKWGGWFAASLLAQPGHPPVRMVSRRGGEVLGEPAVPSLRDLDAAPDLAILAIPAASVEQAVADAAAIGVGAVAVIAAGFGELGEEGRAMQDRLVSCAREAGMLLLGPNCLGLLDTTAGLNATGGEQPAGAVSLVSQSGNLALEVGLMLRAEGTGFARFASVGNQADLTVADLVASLALHEPSRVVAAYVEDPRDGGAFVEAIRACAQAGKPPLVIKAGRSDAGARAALSHTGSLAGSDRVFAAALRDAGGILVESPGDLVDRARALLGGGRRLRAGRVAILADGGGHGVLAADLAAAAGLATPPLAPATIARIQPDMPLTTAANPVDLAGAGESDILSFARVTEALADDDAIEAVLFSGYFGGYAGYTEEAAASELAVVDRLVAVRARTGKAILVQSMQVPSRPPAIAALIEHGIPTYARIENAIRGVGALTGGTAAPRGRARPAPVTPIVRGTYPEARALLAAAGIGFTDGALAVDDDAVGRIAADLGGPVALKAVAPDLLHKSDVGGVVLGVNAADAGAASAAMRTRLGRPLDGVFVERMARPGGVDLVVGARRDPTFGPVVLVGVGGIFVEVLDDVAIALAPADPEHVAALLRTLRAWPLLAGARGTAPVAVAAVAEAARIVGDVLSGRPDLVEIEVNPLRVDEVCAVALDARVVMA